MTKIYLIRTHHYDLKEHFIKENTRRRYTAIYDYMAEIIMMYENINIDIARESITIEGRRERQTETVGNNYHTKELYWGSFARTISLPAEVDPDNVEAFEKHGLLTIKLPRIDKNRTQKVKIRTI